MMKEIVKGMWQFARFLFVPRWGRSKSGNMEGDLRGRRIKLKEYKY
jgi:hypothetical protein